MKNSMKKKILYVVNLDTFFISHRQDIALKAKSFLKIHLASKFEKNIKYFQKKNIYTHNLFIERGKFSFISNLITMLNIFFIIIKIRPDLIHFISIKPVLIGGIISRLFPSVPKIFSITGLGSAFIKDSNFSILKKIFLSFLYKIALKQNKLKIIFQNKDDLNFILKIIRLRKNQYKILKGSGVSLKKYKPKKLNFKMPIVMLPSRIMSHKGVYEFVKAVKFLKKKKILARFVLVGDLEKENPSKIKKHQVMSWVKQNIIEYWGFKSNMSKILNLATIVVLPSYREGFPKVLMEAAACGRPSITTDVPGCRDAVVNNHTGVLVPVRNYKRLAIEIKKLLNDKSRMKKMSLNSRKYALKNFDINNIVNLHMDIYRRILNL